MILGYLTFIKGKDILPTAIAMIVGSLVIEIINRIKNDLILPLARLDYKAIYKRISILNLMEYIGLIFNFLMQTFILYLISN
tara:strand:+ start:3838 stop:4083 length:246 start_codon:yes stop_codon:yes gene_type:complete